MGDAHIRAIEFFSMLLEGHNAVCDGVTACADSAIPLRFSGTGKTHLMAAYGRRLWEELEQKLHHVHENFGDVLQRVFRQYTLRSAQESRATEGEVGYTTLISQGHDYEKRSAPADEFWEAISDFQMRLAGYRYQPANRPHLHRLHELQAVRGASAQRWTRSRPRGSCSRTTSIPRVIRRRSRLCCTCSNGATNLGGRGRPSRRICKRVSLGW